MHFNTDFGTCFIKKCQFEVQPSTKHVSRTQKFRLSGYFGAQSLRQMKCYRVAKRWKKLIHWCKKSMQNLKPLAHIPGKIRGNFCSSTPTPHPPLKINSRHQFQRLKIAYLLFYKNLCKLRLVEDL